VVQVGEQSAAHGHFSLVEECMLLCHHQGAYASKDRLYTFARHTNPVFALRMHGRYAAEIRGASIGQMCSVLEDPTVGFYQSTKPFQMVSLEE
jgi:hypothetical protein